MFVQSGFGTQAYSSIAASSIQRLEGRAVTASAAESVKYAENVSLSDAGKALAASEGASTEKPPYLPYQERILANANADRAYAEEMSYGIAYAYSTIVYDLTDCIKDGSLPANKLAISGRIIDDAFKENFYREAALIDSQRRTLYESEKAKGTDPVEILRKLFDFENAQSSDYQEATSLGWRGEINAKV